MKLKEYLEKERIDPASFAFKSGISITAVYRYLRGEKPHFKRAVKIEKMTKGKVTVEELRGDPENEKDI